MNRFCPFYVGPAYTVAEFDELDYFILLPHCSVIRVGVPQ